MPNTCLRYGMVNAMLLVYRRHEKGCRYDGRATSDSKLKCKLPDGNQKAPGCPVWVRGSLRDGRPVKRQSLNTRTWPLPEEIGAWESGAVQIGGVTPQQGAPAPHEAKGRSTPLEDATNLYLLSKNKRAPDTQRKSKNLTDRLLKYCSTQKPPITTVQAANDFAFLTRFVASWTDANSTQINRRTELIAFFEFCRKARYIEITTAEDLATIPDEKPQTDVFDHEELVAIYNALETLSDEYGRHGTPIAKQTKAFVLVMRYTGLSIGDVAGLRKKHVQDDRIVTNRDKTGKEVYVRVPPIVLRALFDAPHDSAEYFFWSGNGEFKTRKNKWGERLQRLFVHAGVRLTEAPWAKRAMKSKKAKKRAEQSSRIVSGADPRWFRHTLARDLLENEIVTMEELAEILGNTLDVCENHYSKWDRRRQAKIDDKLSRFWSTDPIINAQP